MDGRTRLEDVARQALARFPSVFSRWEDALSRAGDLSVKYSR
jgi:hypothetical protein